MSYCSARLWIPLSPVLAAALAACCDPPSAGPKQAIAMPLPASQGNRPVIEHDGVVPPSAERRMIAM
jgi:hypothetical protein